MINSSSDSNGYGLSSLSVASLAALGCAACAGATAGLGVANGEHSLIALSGFGVVFGLAGWGSLRRAAARIRRASDALAAAADGSPRTRVPDVDRRGDIGRLLVNTNRLIAPV